MVFFCKNGMYNYYIPKRLEILKVKFLNKKVNFNNLGEIFSHKKDKIKLQTDSENTNDSNTNTYMDDGLESDSTNNKRNLKLSKYIDKYWIVVCLLSACIINFLIETISRYSFVKAFSYFFYSWDVFLYNAFIIFVTLTISYLFRKRIFAAMTIGGLWLLGGIANGAVLSYRTTPFTGTDMKLIKSALSLITKYMSIDQMIFTALLAVVVIVLFVIAGMRSPKFKGKMKYRKHLVMLVVLFLSIIPVTKFCVYEKVISSYFGNIANAYVDYGFPYCFWCTVIARGINQPNNYDKSEIQNIVTVDGQDSYNAEDTPNVIFVQLESFFDPELIKNISLSEDPIPNFRNLEKNYTSGYVTVPVTGAGTCNTEFEVLTGMSLRYFGPGEYPYKTVLKDNVCESVAYDLKNIGYSTHAIHDNVASFYSRKTVFSRLGMDTFTSKEMMNIKDYNPIGWAKDSVLKGSIMDCLKSTTGKDFVYTITVQSHGGYPTEKILDNPKITVTGGKDEASANATEYYVNQINEVDQFIGDLVTELSNYDEDTILVLFGDHLPPLGLEEQNLANGSLYQTEYVIWDNMGLKAKDQNLTSYQLSSVALNKIGMHVGTLMNYHQTRMGTSNYYVDLEALQYDMLYGKKYAYGGETPFEKTDLQMGVNDVTISTVTPQLQDSVVIKGENFNDSSIVKVNGEDVETVYVDENTLKLPENVLTLGDVIEVDQVTSTGKVLKAGTPYTYTPAVQGRETSGTPNS